MAGVRLVLSLSRSAASSFRISYDRRDNSHQLVGFCDDGIMCVGEKATPPEHPETEPSLLEFSQRDLFLGNTVAIARSVVGLFIVRTSRSAATEQLVRKCRRDGTAGMQMLHYPHDEARELEQTFAKIVGCVRWTPAVVLHTHALVVLSATSGCGPIGGCGVGRWELVVQSTRDRRNPPYPFPCQRAEPRVPSRLTRTHRTEGPACGDGVRQARHPDHHRRL